MKGIDIHRSSGHTECSLKGNITYFNEMSFKVSAHYLTMNENRNCSNSAGGAFALSMRSVHNSIVMLPEHPPLRSLFASLQKYLIHSNSTQEELDNLDKFSCCALLGWQTPMQINNTYR